MRTYPTVALVRALAHRAPRSLSAALLAVSFVTLSPLATAQSAPAIQSAALNPGSIDGTLNFEGRNAADVIVTVKETGKQAVTNRRGSYRIADVAPGTYTLEATAEGYQKLYITDVVVKPGSRLTLSQVEMRRLSNGVTELERYIVKAESSDVTELDPFEVKGHRPIPFSDANVDIPRTINDAQPYYIFDNKTIEQSGAIDIQDFLKKRLTMNTIGITASQRVINTNLGAGNAENNASAIGNTSAVELRGLGSDKTLVLINGRRMAGAVYNNVAGQPDLNGIPLGAIDRIEVLPSSASGIYGASALGGVVNVILKSRYSGGELRLSYDTPFDTDAPSKSASLTYGAGFNGGKTSIMLTASWTQAEPLLLADRQELFLRGIDTIKKNNPTFAFSSGSPVLGALPNIRSSNGTPLVFVDGTPLGSNSTYVPAGTSPTTSAATLKAGLIANAGKWDLTLPPTNQEPTGLFRSLNKVPETRSYGATLTHELLPKVTVSVQAMHNENASTTFRPPETVFRIPAGSPSNLFINEILIALPTKFTTPFQVTTTTDSLVFSAVAKLPEDWTIQGDYSWSSSNTVQHHISALDYANLDFANRRRLTHNIFVDTLAFPLQDFLTIYDGGKTRGRSYNEDFAIRGSGPLFFVPWVKPTLTAGLGHRIATTPENTTDNLATIPPQRTTYYRREQETNSAYAELSVPLAGPNRIRFVHALDLQIAGRVERYKVDNGTSFKHQDLVTGDVLFFSGTTVNGQPYFSKASYSSTNSTVGLKYQPTPEFTVRVSMGDAFLPPSPDLLLKNPLPPSTFLTPINDPKKNQSYGVQTIFGGNPSLRPQNSSNYNAGIIWYPTAPLLKGLRLNAEYYKIQQFDAVGYLSAQQIINEEALYSDRVIRDSSGIITLVDRSALNLFKRETEGFDLNLGYDYKTSVGVFSFNGQHTTIFSLKSQLSKTLPVFDSLEFPSEGGAPKHKASLALNWRHKGWTAGWATRFTSAYRQFATKGGPTYERSALFGGVSDFDRRYAAAQGSSTIPSQSYHDAFVSYKFGGSSAKGAPLGDRLLSNLTVQVGVNNVFNTIPPVDVYYDLYLSPFGDTRLRSYRVSIKKEF